MILCILCVYNFVCANTFSQAWFISLNIHEFIHAVVYSTNLIMHNSIVFQCMSVSQLLIH